MNQLVKSNKPIVLTPTQGKEYWEEDIVRETVMRDQGKKCMFCEFTRNGAGRIMEHFRPKGRVDIISPNGLVTQHHPGYHWLRNDWDNLAYACAECNSSYKRCFFPLINEQNRASAAIDITRQTSADKDITNEEPLILNAYHDVLDNHLKFRRWEAVPVTDQNGNVSMKGDYTIRLFHLNDRPELVEQRKEVWSSWEVLKLALELANMVGDASKIGAINRSISLGLQPNALFLGMKLRQI